MEIVFKLLILCFLISLNGFFVASEYVLISLRRTHVEDMARGGNVSAKLLAEALDHLTQYISATQLGVTIASLAIGWLGESTIAVVITPLFTTLPQPLNAITANTVATVIAFVFVTFLTIVFGELAPKKTALQRTERMGFLIIRPLTLFTRIFLPGIWLLNASGNAVVKLVGLSPRDIKPQIYSEREINMIASSSAASGAIQQEEAELVSKALMFDDIAVREIMLPRQKIRALQADIPLAKAVTMVLGEVHSRFPVYTDSLDHISGIVYVKDMYHLLLQGHEQTPLGKTHIIHPALFIQEMQPVSEVLLKMRKKQVQIAVVQNKHGKTAGLVTMENIFESLVGNIEEKF